MKIILLGPPGAGKGTIARALTQYDGSVQISTGDILRAAVAAGTELGKQAEAAMNAGELVSDALIISLVEVRLKEKDCARGYLLDGFPRTIPQAEALQTLLTRMGEKLDAVLELNIPRDTIIDRLITRRTCTQCGEIYNIKTKPPKTDGICDICGSDKIIQRDDETETTIKNRLRVYEAETAQLSGFYHSTGLLTRIDTSDLDAVITVLGIG